MKIVVDAHFPELLSEMFVREGYDSAHVRDVLERDVDDANIWRYAARHAPSVIVTRDADFRGLPRGLPDEPAVIWLRIGNCSNSKLLAVMRDRIAGTISVIRSGQKIVEIR